MLARTRDKLTFDFFEVPTPMPSLPGQLDLDIPLRDTLAEALKRCAHDRHAVAAEMSRLTGRDVSKSMLDAYTAESRSDHNFPFRYAAAFETVTGSFGLTNLLAAARGCKVFVGKEALLADLGRIETMELELRQQRATLKQLLATRK